MYTPLPEHNGGKIFCSYEQIDSNGNPLFEPVEEHELIEVDYILPPLTEMKDIPIAAVSLKEYFKLYQNYKLRI